MASIISVSPPEPKPHEPEISKRPRQTPKKLLSPDPQPITLEQIVAPAESPIAPPNAAPRMISTPVEPAPAYIPARFDAAYLDNPAPLYPLAARRKGEQGKLLLYAHVKADGSASLVEVRNSSGFPGLDEVALNAVKRWRFIPGRLGSENIDSNVLVPVVFRLHE